MVRAPLRSAVLAFIAAMVVTILPGARVQPAAAVSPDIVISQIYGGGGNAGATLTNDFIELYNRGTASVHLTGWSVQYASATGSTWQVTALTGSLEPGAYYLVQEAQGAGGTTPLPKPSATGSIPMSGTAGKVALVTNTTALNTVCGSNCDTAAGVRDYVGYGATATDFEGAGPTPNLSNTTAAVRAADGATDTDSNVADFSVAAPNPRTKEPPDPDPDAAPSVTATVPSNNATEVALDSHIALTFSEPVTVNGNWFTISCSLSGTHTAGLSGGPTTYTLNPNTDFVENDVCTVTISASGILDLDTQDPPNTMAANHVFSFAAVAGEVCGTPATPIHQIQGSGATTSMAGSPVTIEGVVVGDFQPSTATSFNGFHVQEEDDDADTNAATSEGIFVFEGGSAVEVEEGDIVRVTGIAGEFLSSGQNMTQITNVTQVVVCGEDVSVTPSVVDMPFASTTYAERFEGMLVTFDTDEPIVVTETFNFGRFGELVLTTGERLWTPTHLVDPGTPATALQAENDRDRIVLDDGRNDQNIDPTLFPEGGLSAANTLRVGDTMTGGTFVLEQRFGLYRVQPTSDLPDFASTNARPEGPPDVGGDLRVAAMNVLNYFTTFDSIRGSNNGPNVCGPLGNQECRGANTQSEFDRQRTRIIEAILGLDASVVGLMEIENNESASTQDLVDGLNDATAPGTWAFVDTGTIGGDAIKVALIYRPADVTPVGDHAILDSDVDPRFDDTRSRPALAQTFDAAGGGRFTVVVNHLKSKGSACAGDPDIGDGQGNCNVTRTMAAEALVDWIATDPTGSGDRDALVIGDLNSYAQEDPIDVFRDAGYTDTLNAFLGSDAYSYVFQGQTGYLDHALATPTLATQVTGAAEWHINADEPPVLDYNDDFKSANHVQTLYAPDPYRSSDHDPLVVGLDLLEFGFEGFLPPVQASGTATANAGSTIPVRFRLTETTGLDVLFVPSSSWQVDCTTGEPIGTPARTGATVGLTQDPNGSYTYDWKTLKSWANTCRVFEVTFDDGAYRMIAVRFLK